MFFASKLLSFAIEPLFWVLLFLLSGLLLLQRRPRLGRRLSWLALIVLALSGWTSAPEAMLRTLESRYPASPSLDPQRFVGVVVLGGGLSHSDLWTTYKQVALNEQAERMTEAVGLLRRYPHLRLLFTGGDASVAADGISEAQRARMFFDAMGVDATRASYEARSRNTYENARFSAAVQGIDHQQPWLLLTSAFHMPRAMGVFVRAGWNATPWPVDYRTTPPDSWFDFSLHDGPRLWELALHEWLGFIAYRVAGWI